MPRIHFVLLTVFLGVCQSQTVTPPEKPVTLLSGMGTWHHRIATTNPEAQRYFDQGLQLLYGFNRYEALRSFTKASQLDPSAAMAWWGIAMAQSPHINMDLDGDVDLKKACQAVETARKLANVPAVERAWIEALDKRCPDDRPGAYIHAMKALEMLYADDLDGLTLYAESLMVPVRWHWYDRSGRPAEGVMEAENVLEEVLRRRPDHPGANHLYIHVVESSPRPERAIPSAERLMGIVPAAGHLVHMPGHIWMVLGDYEMAARVNERAVIVDREYFERTGVSGTYLGYYIHNLHFVAHARSMQGRTSDAMRAADEIAADVQPMAATMPDMADQFSALRLFVRVRGGRWDELLSGSAPDGRFPVSNLFWHYARALALAAKGRRAEALGEQTAFEAGRTKLAANAAWGGGMNNAREAVAVASEVLAGRLADSPAAAVERFRRAVELQDRLLYDEPPAWYYPTRESLGAALLRMGNAAEAETVFREGLRLGPRNGRMLFGLMQSLNAQQKDDGAEWVAREFETAWKGSEMELHIEDL